MEKPYYKAVMLVLASDNAPIYKELRKIFRAYMHENENIKVLFVYGEGTNFDVTDDDLVYPDIPENYYPGMITKTIRALEHIEETYNYDFFIRTNISTFWDFDRLLKRLDKQPLRDCFTGTIRGCKYKDQVSPQYIAGVNLVLSRDLSRKMISVKEELLSWDLPEDWAMSKVFIDSGLKPRPSLPGAIHFMEKFKSVDEQPILEEIETARKMEHDHFRIKNNHNRLEIDIAVAKVLLKEYYGKTINT